MAPELHLMGFRKTGDRPKGTGQVDVRQGAKGLGDDRTEAERELLDLLGYG